MKATFLLGGGCLALLACTMDDPCAEPEGAACGGDPTGDWAITGSCRDPAYANPEAVTYYDQTQNMARQPPPEPTSSDWCSYLLYDPVMGITRFTFPHDTQAIATGTVSYTGEGYAAKPTTIGGGSVDISGSCLTRFGVLFQCAARDTSTPADVRSVQDDLADYEVRQGAPNQNLDCADDGSGGCLCTYSLTSEQTGGPLSGRWSIQGALLTHFGGNNLLPSQADLCVKGDTLTLWGHDRTAIWDQPGLRTITLTRTQP